MKPLVLLLVLVAPSLCFSQAEKPPSPEVKVAASCLIVKRMGPADEVTSRLYSFGIRGKQFQYVEGDFPKGISFHGRLTDNDVRKIMDKGGKVRIVEPKYTQDDLAMTRKSCADSTTISASSEEKPKEGAEPSTAATK